MNRGQLRGLPLFPECYRAKTMREDGDTVCGGLHKDGNSFFLADDVIDQCRECRAWHMNHDKDKEVKHGEC